MTTRQKRDRQKENRAASGRHTLDDHPLGPIIPGKKTLGPANCPICQPIGQTSAPTSVGKVSKWRGSGRQLLDLLPGVRTSKHAQGRTSPRKPR